MANALARKGELGGGHPMPEAQRNAMRRLLEDGIRNISKIAEMCGVSRTTVYKALRDDPELREAHEAAWMARMEDIEEVAMDLAENSENDMARAKVLETLLKGRMSKVYSEALHKVNDPSSAPRRINVMPILPIIKTNVDGMPIEGQKIPEGVNFKKPVIIDVNAE